MFRSYIESASAFDGETEPETQMYDNRVKTTAKQQSLGMDSNIHPVSAHCLSLKAIEMNGISSHSGSGALNVCTIVLH